MAGEVPFIGSLYNPVSGCFVNTTSHKYETYKVQLKNLQLDVNLKLKEVDQSYLQLEDCSHAIVGITFDYNLSKKNEQITSTVWLHGFDADSDSIEYLPLENLQINNLKVNGVTLVEMDTFNDYVGNKDDLLMNDLNIDLVNGFITDDCQFFDDVNKFINNKSNNCKKYLPKSDVKEMEKWSNCRQNAQSKIFNTFNKITIELWLSNVETVFSHIIKFLTLVDTHKGVYADIKNDWRERTNIAGKLLDDDIKFVDSTQSLSELIQDIDMEYYVIFFSMNLNKRNRKQFHASFKFFNQLHDDNANNNMIKFIAVDVDLHENLPVNLPNYVTVGLYKNNKWASLDVFRDTTKTGARTNYAKCPKEQRADGKPSQRTLFRAPCPSCNEEPVQWYCTDCNCLLQYGFDDFLYCNCGKCLMRFYMFKCGDWKHGVEYIEPVPEYYKCVLNLKQMKEINLLILGATGVGKSTWINSMINYTRYQTLEEASRSEILITVPTKFVVMGDDYRPTHIKLGYDNNEITHIGSSATQECRTYNIYYNEMFINLIDTPGMGDTEGVEKDKINVRNILDHISYKSRINGICILLKPNESRLGPFFTYCVKEILTHLHKDAAKNIIFCFTNTRQTFYKPGETMGTLQKLLHDISIGYLLEKNRFDRIYCLDNEAFRFLCTLSYPNITHNEADRKSYHDSWDKSVEETRRMLNYIYTLEPHKVEETMTLNHARTIILCLTKPMAEITQNIETNIAALNQQRRLVSAWTRSEKELEENLYVKQTIMVAVPLGFPMTVCTSEKCVRHCKIEGRSNTETAYVTHCHEHCYLRNVIPEQLREPALIHCAAMRGEYCSRCSCHWTKHMHILYTLERKVERILDTGAQSRQQSNLNLKDKKENALRTMINRIKELEKEKEEIMKISAKFGHFLRTNAITPYNDSMNDYLKYLVEQELSKPDKTEVDRSVLEQLKKTQAAYGEEVKAIQNAIKHHTNDVTFTPNDINKLQEDLYNLPINGEQLKRIMEVAIAAQKSYSAHSDKMLGNQTVSQMRGIGRGRGSGGNQRSDVGGRGRGSGNRGRPRGGRRGHRF